MFQNNLTTKGFTYIELLMVLGIMGVILSFSMVMSMSSISRSSVIQERDLFVSLLLTGARAEAIANVSQKSHGIHIDNTNHRYILFTGNTFSPSNATNRITPYTDSGIIISNAAHDTEYNILFDQLSGNVHEGAGVITISQTSNNTTQEIVINAVGQINW
jgi:prepilin-type N-terminal cleavage/methylation domain-containing protein